MGTWHGFLRADPPAQSAPADTKEPFFQTRGVVLTPDDMATWPWPREAKQAGLSTIGTHIFPHQVAAFVETDEGKAFLDTCRDLGLEVEHELHAMSDLLPRSLFEKHPDMFRMDDRGSRVADYNLCVHSKAALDVVGENAAKYAALLKPTTGRYFFWIDDNRPMCCCPDCRGFSDTEQALILENHLLGVLRKADPRATLAHLAYVRTLAPPRQVKPDPGVFFEFAPYRRRYDAPLSRRDSRLNANAPTHGEHLDLLDANLEVFGAAGAQALEYWIDVSRFSGFTRGDKRPKIPWNPEVFLDDLDTYGKRGIRHLTSFAVRLDGQYVERHGQPPLAEYGQGMLRWRPTIP
jgi:hypothetical protein